MGLYEMYWIKYFKSQRAMSDMYTSFLKIPLAGATLPVFGFFFLGVYAENMFLMASAVILAVGHIGIHFNHSKEIKY